MNSENWKTGITKVQPNKLLLRGYPIDELIGRISFAQAASLAIKGELPPPQEARLLEAMMVSSIDHGVTPPSCLAARTIASAGSPLNAALAGGILSISKNHGGAIEGAQRVFGEAVRRQREAGLEPAQAALELIRRYREEKKRLPGFGHRFHTRDPRAVRLLSLAEELGLAGPYTAMARAMETALAQETGKKLPLNVDGAIAALLGGMDYPPELANAFFMMARLPGLVAHVFEEMTRMRPHAPH